MYSIDLGVSPPYFGPMTPFDRRKILIARNEELEAQGFGCKGCSGNCCTFEANSMMVTPLEAVELMTYLKENNLNTDELKVKCENTVKQYRLDHDGGNGRRSYLRRTYTCPFFGHMELGCPLPRSVKPYGCIAFHTHHAELKAGEHCYSEIDLLKKREELHEDEALQNQQIKDRLGIWWEKSPLPLALLDIWNREL